MEKAAAEEEKAQGTSLALTAKPSSSEITIKEFLDFLRTAYQVQDSLESMLLANGMTEAVDWLKLKENELVKPKDIEPEPKPKQEDKRDLTRKKSDSSSDGDPIKRKLSEVLSEGLLDSVLPYLVPSSSQQTSRRSSVAKVPTEVEIHVCDEVKNMKKDFVCNQKLLVEKMGYFAEVTTGQRLEDMDISVHCDIGIFEWLMKWVKKDSLLEEDWPQLDPQWNLCKTTACSSATNT
ncbi:hypothetical protein GEV33_000565 [Tenebrio molitor]|uniref:SANT and BTB domain-containing protein n=1 Tax=Tenebrio molitor TaxID=7067 RepID=A0A8J6HUM8_TENMO|nr:hypothetical protein GEV33_000565 [Tenebrio molitor]